ncbi:uncharacterized protein PGTG_19937 [Puccinia graminis f. sp. tritici CRL 75-36-700-3]|uniref:Uncharacterized protein n=1 Tax=Puccinia graminis f. sp. tritici (strain CRL 75-36-700-3 / race SCCL) TaxID=418459 RepID=E3LBR1_PUCGT|nr:uncharacterized protein PGTG_19937 [Puccinia graminis f. sp. tritici CRL 75-36-700-3]EFP93983.1 hypothetical protein PGTG_19937 [Puccinia graminis f. sp. tritici CRL 75-36-700-3]
MDDVRPWIIKKIVEGPLKRLETESILDNRTASVLPLEPFCTQKLQLDRFQSPHRWGSQGPVWAEASSKSSSPISRLINAHSANSAFPPSCSAVVAGFGTPLLIPIATATESSKTKKTRKIFDRRTCSDMVYGCQISSDCGNVLGRVMW